MMNAASMVFSQPAMFENGNSPASICCLSVRRLIIVSLGRPQCIIGTPMYGRNSGPPRIGRNRRHFGRWRGGLQSLKAHATFAALRFHKMATSGGKRTLSPTDTARDFQFLDGYWIRVNIAHWAQGASAHNIDFKSVKVRIDRGDSLLDFVINN
jgi:hypothetical protein